jgi:hypothetical protein
VACWSLAKCLAQTSISRSHRRRTFKAAFRSKPPSKKGGSLKRRQEAAEAKQRQRRERAIRAATANLEATERKHTETLDKIEATKWPLGRFIPSRIRVLKPAGFL